MIQSNPIMLGTAFDSNLEMQQGNLLIMGANEEHKQRIATYPIFQQLMGRKTEGLTILDPIGQTAKIAYAMAKQQRRKVTYLDPGLNNLKFNPLHGDEDHVINNFVQFFSQESINLSEMDIQKGRNLITTAIKVLKRLYGNKASLYDLYDLIWNPAGKARRIITLFSRLEESSPTRSIERDLIVCHMMRYYTDNSREFQEASHVRAFFGELFTTQAMSQVFHVTEENRSDILVFDSAFRGKEVLIINLNASLLGVDAVSKLTNLLLFSLQSAIARQTKSVDHTLYIKEMAFLKPHFRELLQSSHYRKLSIIAETQNLNLLEEQEKCYTHTSFSSFFPNLLFVPSQHMRDEEIVRQMGFSPTNLEQFHGHRFQEDDICYRVLRSAAFNDFDRGISQAVRLPESDLAFYHARLKRYENAFDKATSV